MSSELALRVEATCKLQHHREVISSFDPCSEKPAAGMLIARPGVSVRSAMEAEVRRLRREAKASDAGAGWLGGSRAWGTDR